MTLDEFVNETIRLSAPHRYVPTKFIAMRAEHGTAEAIRRLIETSEPQSGFHRLCELGLRDWTLEAAVLKFPNEAAFSKKTATYAQARLDGQLDP